MARPLIYPGSDLAAYTQVGPVNQPQKWKRVGDAVTTVTAVVHLQNDPPQNCYILTTGHSFRDRDDNKRNKSTPQHTWNVIGEPDQDRAVGLEHGQDKTAWDLKTRADVFLQNAPIGMSFGRYHCPGDKLNSRTDAGLIRILPNPIPANTFDNTYRNEAGTIAIRITQIAAAWPPAPLAAGQIYFAGNERHLSHNLNPFVNTFDSSFLNWELKQATNLSPADRIILCVDDETSTYASIPCLQIIQSTRAFTDYIWQPLGECQECP